jgi:hypothetical protein
MWSSRDRPIDGQMQIRHARGLLTTNNAPVDGRPSAAIRVRSTLVAAMIVIACDAAVFVAWTLSHATGEASESGVTAADGSDPSATAHATDSSSCVPDQTIEPSVPR